MKQSIPDTATPGNYLYCVLKDDLNCYNLQCGQMRRLLLIIGGIEKNLHYGQIKRQLLIIGGVET